VIDIWRAPLIPRRGMKQSGNRKKREGEPMARPQPISVDQLAEALLSLFGWREEGRALVRTFECTNFTAAMALVNDVAAIAEELDHHPDMLIQYAKVTFMLSSHDAGGITQRDLALAKRIDTAAGKGK
jgi:4a-hydroxytetrahydrobiopterin dehydratase